jgi:sugar O-acyltransferase (sialic acid O-acetyltransferase NeuD family)
MMKQKKVVIFGTLDTAELAHFYLEHDSPHLVVAFTVNQEFLSASLFKDLPVVPFEKLEQYYPPDDFVLFAPMTAKSMNRNREKIYLEGKKKGYEFLTYISSKATVYPGAEIGENCFILEDNTLQPFTSIGNNVVLWSGNHIGHHGQIADNVFFTSHVVLSGHCVVESNAFFGVNSTIRDYITIKQGSLIAMGASINKDTEEWGVYIGNPARKGSKPSYEVY